MSKKNGRPYRPRPVTADTMAVALHQAAKPADACTELLDKLAACLKALREGVATEYQWSVVSGSVALALAIEQRGIVRGLKEHLVSADSAMVTIYDRALRSGGGRWVHVTLMYQEIDALHAFLNLHTFQIRQLARCELLEAIAAAQKAIRAKGHTVTVEREQERMAA
jgi:hypothetical protein